MTYAQKKVLSVVHKMGQGPTPTVVLPMLDRHLVVIEKERDIIGGKLIAVVRELLADGLLAQGDGMRLRLTDAGRNALEADAA